MSTPRKRFYLDGDEALRAQVTLAFERAFTHAYAGHVEKARKALDRISAGLFDVSDALDARDLDEYCELLGRLERAVEE